MTRILKRSEGIVGAWHDLRKVRNVVRLLYRPIAIRSYIKSARPRKLQIGSGPRALDSWLCTDINPRVRNIIYLDATRPFPFAANTFDYIFCEHMIEHISHEQGLSMLRHCHRVLRPGGTIRIATPDLKVLIGLYGSSLDARQIQYIRWITDRFIRVGVYKASFVINNAFRNWGHQFLYDGELLQMGMKEAGFTDLKQRTPGESDDDNLKGLEAHGDIIEEKEMNIFETMIFEGVCSK
jgi:predicted SAM-dependent methyltransferase